MSIFGKKPEQVPSDVGMTSIPTEEYNALISELSKFRFESELTAFATEKASLLQFNGNIAEVVAEASTHENLSDAKLAVFEALTVKAKEEVQNDTKAIVDSLNDSVGEQADSEETGAEPTSRNEALKIVKTETGLTGRQAVEAASAKYPKLWSK